MLVITSLISPDNECQPSSNNFWSYKSGNYTVIWMLLYKINVFTVIMGKWVSDMLPFRPQQWPSVEKQWCLVKYLGHSKWCLIADFYTQGVRSLNQQISNRYSQERLTDINNLNTFQCSNSVFIRVLAKKTGQNYIYEEQWLDCTLINHNAWSKMVDAALTHTFKMRQGACSILSCL